MPIVKPVKLKQPLWKEWDEAAKKKGQHQTVYSVNGDHYTGEWLNNKKNGIFFNLSTEFFINKLF